MYYTLVHTGKQTAYGQSPIEPTLPRYIVSHVLPCLFAVRPSIMMSSTSRESHAVTFQWTRHNEDHRRLSACVPLPRRCGRGEEGPTRREEAHGQIHYQQRDHLRHRAGG